jgi:beta-glucosidase-like glycosyl hydrolase
LRSAARPVKHFVANEQEADRMRSSSNMDERTLREIYLQPFEMIVKEAHRIEVGASSRDIRQSREVQWAAPRDKRTPPPDAAGAFDPF